MWKQLPPLQLGALTGALDAMIRKGLLLRDPDAERRIQRLHLEALFLDVQEQLAREQRPTAGLGIAVHDQRRRLELPVESCRGSGVSILARTAKVYAGERDPVVVMVVSMFFARVGGKAAGSRIRHLWASRIWRGRSVVQFAVGDQGGGCPDGSLGAFGDSVG